MTLSMMPIITLRCREFLEITVDQAIIPAVDSEDFPALENGGACDGPDGGVHTGGIAPGCHYSYSFDFSHFILLLHSAA